MSLKKDTELLALQRPQNYWCTEYKWACLGFFCNWQFWPTNPDKLLGVLEILWFLSIPVLSVLNNYKKIFNISIATPGEQCKPERDSQQGNTFGYYKNSNYPRAGLWWRDSFVPDKLRGTWFTFYGRVRGSHPWEWAELRVPQLPQVTKLLALLQGMG